MFNTSTGEFDCLYSNYTNFTIPTNLNFTNYYWRINVSDLAGNENTTTNGKQFTVDETCSILKAGWNLCGIVNEKGMTAWDIYQQTAATQISIQNRTNRSLFTSWITIDSPNFTIEEGEAAFIYVEINTDWTYRVWNILNESRISNINLTNASGSGFFPLMNPHRSGLYFQMLDYYFQNSGEIQSGLTKRWDTRNTSLIDYMSYYNNSATTSYRFTPYFHNVTLNNNTFMKYGEVTWIYINNESYVVNRTLFTKYT